MTTRPEEKPRIFRSDPELTDDINNLLKSGYTSNQPITAGEFNKMMSQVQKWTEYLEAEREGLDKKSEALDEKIEQLKSLYNSNRSDSYDLDNSTKLATAKAVRDLYNNRTDSYYSNDPNKLASAKAVTNLYNNRNHSYDLDNGNKLASSKAVHDLYQTTYGNRSNSYYLNDGNKLATAKAVYNLYQNRSDSYNLPDSNKFATAKAVNNLYKNRSSSYTSSDSNKFATSKAVNDLNSSVNSQLSALRNDLNTLQSNHNALQTNHDALKAKEAATIGQIVYFPVGADVFGDYLLLNGKELDVSAYQALWDWANANSKVIYHGDSYHNYYDGNNTHIYKDYRYDANITDSSVFDKSKHHASFFGFVAVGTTSNNKDAVTKFLIPRLSGQYFRQISGSSGAYSQPFNRLAQSYEKHDHNISDNWGLMYRDGHWTVKGTDNTHHEANLATQPRKMPSKGGAETRPATVMLGAYIKAK